MSLRIRLILSIAALVMLTAVALSVLHLDTLANSLSKDAFDRANFAGQQASSLVDNFINQNSAQVETPADREGLIQLWNRLISGDPQLSGRLLEIMAPAPSILEINVAGQNGQVLASSNPSRISGPLPKAAMFSDWRDSPLRRRMLDLFVYRPDYQVVVPLGQVTAPTGTTDYVGVDHVGADRVGTEHVGTEHAGTEQGGADKGAGPDHTIFTIQVVTSSVLLRAALLPDVEWLAAVSGGAVLASLLLTAFAASWVLQPLKRIERTIDRIVQGSFGRPEDTAIGETSGMAKEFAALESKLNVLGRQFRGAREEASEKQHSLDQLLERMASQFDVASRLAAISRISGGVAHEIKNPLNAISLRLDLLRERLGAPPEELAPEIDILSKEVRRLDRVVKTFLDFTRPVEVRFEQVDLAALAREVADLMKPQARLARIALEFEAADDFPALIRGDADMLKQAVLNLVTNALDAMSNAMAKAMPALSNATLAVTEETADSAADAAPHVTTGVAEDLIPGVAADLVPGGELRLRVEHAGDAVRLEVADNGPGIPQDLRNKVFQLYFTTKQRGSGIGLAMTYRAVQLHNGTIDFTSEDGRGTTFRLQFPALVGHA
jgi:signal transduction histidine kinase